MNTKLYKWDFKQMDDVIYFPILENTIFNNANTRDDEIRNSSTWEIIMCDNSTDNFGTLKSFRADDLTITLNDWMICAIGEDYVGVYEIFNVRIKQNKETVAITFTIIRARDWFGVTRKNDWRIND